MPNLLNPSGDKKLTEQELKLSYWFLSHKLLLKKILTGVIIGIGGIFWLYALIGLVDWAIVTGPKERANLKTILQIKTSPAALSESAAKNIIFTDAEIFSSGVGRYDFTAQAQNSNSKWWAEFDYQFMGEGLTDGAKKGFILPGESKYIVNLGVELAFRPRNARLAIQNLKYHRVNPHNIPDYEKWRDEHLNILVSNKAFNSNLSQGNKNISTLSFTAKNNTAYSFWSLGFYGMLYRGEQLVSINYLAAENFTAGESRDLQMQFYEGLPSITKYDVVPEVNVFDESGYKELE